MEDFKFVSRNVVDRSHSRGREGDGFDPDTTSATNQKRGGLGVSRVVGKPCSVAASAFAVLCPYYTATSSDLLTFLHVFHLASTSSTSIGPLPNIVATNSCKADLKSLWCLKMFFFSNKKPTHQLRPWLSWSGPKRREDHPNPCWGSTEPVWRDRMGLEFSRMPNIEIAIEIVNASMILYEHIVPYCSILFREDFGRCFHACLPHVLRVRPWSKLRLIYALPPRWDHKSLQIVSW